MRYKSIIWHLLLIHCFSNTALINLNTDIKAKLIKMSRVISFHRECSLGIIFNEKGFLKNSKNEIMPLLQSYSNFLVFKNPWGAVFKILHLCFLFFSIRWKGLFPNAGKASQSTVSVEKYGLGSKDCRNLPKLIILRTEWHRYPFGVIRRSLILTC